ncbi:MAG: glycine betaine ABC transporter substrate-binding protein [Acidimicrobiia bacterium]
MRRRRRPTWATLAAVLLSVVASVGACGGDDDDDDAGDEGASGQLAEAYDLSGATFTVGSKEFTEQLILGHITRLALEAAGADVEDEIGLEGSNVAREALLSGEIDMYWEYTGTGWITHLGETEPIPDSTEQYEAVASRDLEENGIKWLEPAPFNNTYALAVRSGAVEELGVRTLSDLGGLIEDEPAEATLCVGAEFSARDDGLPGLEQHYGYEFPPDGIAQVQDAIVYSQVDQGEVCNFGSVFSTDGRIVGLDLFLLDDDKNFFPKFNPSLTVRAEVFDEHPDLAEMFAEIAPALDEAVMTGLNAEVDVDGELPEDVARQWLQEEGLIG